MDVDGVVVKRSSVLHYLHRCAKGEREQIYQESWHGALL